MLPTDKTGMISSINFENATCIGDDILQLPMLVVRNHPYRSKLTIKYILKKDDILADSLFTFLTNGSHTFEALKLPVIYP